jgi:hypothetical protein
MKDNHMDTMGNSETPADGGSSPLARTIFVEVFLQTLQPVLAPKSSLRTHAELLVAAGLAGDTISTTDRLGFFLHARHAI